MLLSRAGVGVIDRLETLGAVFEIVTVFDTTAEPLAVPSFGVTTQ